MYYSKNELKNIISPFHFYSFRSVKLLQNHLKDPFRMQSKGVDFVQFNFLKTCSRAGCNKVAPVSGICTGCKVCYHCSSTCHLFDLVHKHEMLCPKLWKYHQMCTFILPHTLEMFNLHSIHAWLHTYPDILEMMQKGDAWLHVMLPFEFNENSTPDSCMAEIKKLCVVGIKHVKEVKLQLPSEVPVMYNKKRLCIVPEEFRISRKDLSFPSPNTDNKVGVYIVFHGIIPLNDKEAKESGMYRTTKGHSFGRSIGFQVKFPKTEIAAAVVEVKQDKADDKKASTAKTSSDVKSFVLHNISRVCDNPECQYHKNIQKICKDKVGCRACTRCKSVNYCTEKCQIICWESHKPHCKTASLNDETISNRVRKIVSGFKALAPSDRPYLDDKYQEISLVDDDFSLENEIKFNWLFLNRAVSKEIKTLSETSDGAMWLEHSSKNCLVKIIYHPYASKQRVGDKREHTIWLMYPKRAKTEDTDPMPLSLFAET